MMRSSVLSIFPHFVAHYEGRTNFMYLDDEGYVTTGVGNKIDPLTSDVFNYGWEVDGRPATSEEIQSSWETVKAASDSDQEGGAHYANLPGNVVRLPAARIDQLVQRVLQQDYQNLLRYFPRLDSAPASGQLGVLSMAWGMGSAFAPGYPHFTAAVNSGDWTTAAAESHESNGAPARNAVNKELFLTAAQSDSGQADMDAFPASALAAAGAGAASGAASDVTDVVSNTRGAAFGVGAGGLALAAGCAYVAWKLLTGGK